MSAKKRSKRNQKRNDWLDQSVMDAAGVDPNERFCAQCKTWYRADNPDWAAQHANHS